MEDEPVFLAFLVGVGRNSATYAILSEWVGKAEDGMEYRTARLASRNRLNEALYKMDRDARQIQDWSDLYSWLGRDHGTWAAFSQQTAATQLPHWFLDSVKYKCKRSPENIPTEFIDADFVGVSTERLHDLTGSIDSTGGFIARIQIESNLVLTTRPIFAEV